MKTKSVIGICIAIVGVLGLTAFAISNNLVFLLAGFILTAVGALCPFIFKEKVIITQEDKQAIVDDTMIAELALRNKTIEELNRKLAEKDLPEYIQIVKNDLEKNDYAKAIKRLDAYKKKKDAEFYIFQAKVYIADNRFEEAEENYIQAVTVWPSFENIFATAKFYTMLNKFDEAKEYYSRCLSMEISLADRARVLIEWSGIFWKLNDYHEAENISMESLQIVRQLAGQDPTYMPDLAAILNNLGILHYNMENCDKSKTYYNEALEIYRALAVKAPDTYNQDLAMTFNNIGVLNFKLQDYEHAKTCHKESLQIYRGLAAKEPKKYNPTLANSLNNFGALYDSMKYYGQAEQFYIEALQIYQELVRNNPQAYNPALSNTLHNLGNLYATKPEPDYGKAEECYNESLKIRRALAAEYPQVWNPDLAKTLVYMSIFYLKYFPNKSLSIGYAEEAIARLEGYNNTPLVRELRDDANKVLAYWKDN